MTEKAKEVKAPGQSQLDPESTHELRTELVAHFRNMREPLRRQWVEAMTLKGLTEGQTEQETEAESKTIFDTTVDCLDTATFTSAEIYASAMAERGVLRGMSPEQIIGSILTLRDVLGRSLFERYQNSVERLSAAHDIYDPVSNTILTMLALAFIQERERVVNQQQEAILGLSTPVLQLRTGILILPIVGLIDSQRAQQLTEQLLEGIRVTRARVV
ncbi:MAG TPA: hypothetical protein VK357_06375, partial [Rubrobacteraceae bacterium]|nr:hypothetical protein [Rubrobacteraceae bacterium]